MREPGRVLIRKERAKHGPRLFTAEEICRMMDAAGPELHAMILLGINVGYGNTDCERLEPRHLNLHIGWAHFPRPKTGIQRRAKLWPETVQAITAWQAERSNNELARVFARSPEGIVRDVAKSLKICPLRDAKGNVIKPVAIHHHLLLGLSKPPAWPVEPDKLRELRSQMKIRKRPRRV